MHVSLHFIYTFKNSSAVDIKSSGFSAVFGVSGTTALATAFIEASHVNLFFFLDSSDKTSLYHKERSIFSLRTTWLSRLNAMALLERSDVNQVSKG